MKVWANGGFCIKRYYARAVKGPLRTLGRVFDVVKSPKVRLIVLVDLFYVQKVRMSFGTRSRDPDHARWLPASSSIGDPVPSSAAVGPE
jgi:hypothetical protein